jgi:UDP-glucose:(heptosyl)LPS alpha-1,3-glucosyltransferase
MGASGTMRVAMAGRYYNRQGGVSRCIAELSDRAAVTDDVTVFASEVLDRGESNARFVRVPMFRRPAWLQSQTFAVALRRPLRTQHFDIVHVHNPQGIGADVYTAHSCHAAYLAMRRAEGGAAAWLSRIYPPHVVELAFERYCYRSSPGIVIALTPVVQTELERHIGLDPARIRVVPNGVDLDTFRPPDSREAARRAFAPSSAQTPAGAPVLLFAGYEFERKGLAQVIEALAQLADARPHLWVAGGADAAPYARLAKRAGVADRVHFLGHQAEMTPLFQAADAFVLPTSYEPFGLVLIEALACGTPVITSRLAGMAGWMEDGAEGLLLDRPEDARELAAAIARFVGGRDDWPRMQRAARTLAEGFGWDEIWRQTRAVYEEVLESRTRSKSAPQRSANMP